MSCLSVVRFGPTENNEAASLLRNAILDHFESNEGTLVISNRYFTARVILSNIESDRSKETLSKEDGVILVFDHSNFDSLNAAHDLAMNHGVGELLRLCVGVSVGEHSTHEQEYSRRVLWCLDRGYEYVEVDLSEAGLARGHDERDKEGFARIVEAINGTVWSSAVMAKSKKIDFRRTLQQDANLLQHGGETVTEYASIPTHPSMLVTTESDVQREEKAKQALLGQLGMLSDTYSDENDDTMKRADKSVHERQQEHILQQMEEALHKATEIREKSRLGKLSDDERRNRAGDAANLLLGLMNQIGFDDSESEEEELEPVVDKDHHSNETELR